MFRKHITARSQTNAGTAHLVHAVDVDKQNMRLVAARAAPRIINQSLTLHKLTIVALLGFPCSTNLRIALGVKVLVDVQTVIAFPQAIVR